jgi:hypothetical protein
MLPSHAATAGLAFPMFSYLFSLLARLISSLLNVAL